MKKKALRKDFYMEIRRSMGRFLSIFFIVAIGVAFFAGIRATEPDMRLSGDEYFDEANLMDIQVISTLGLTDDDVEALEDVEGIEKVEAGYSTDVLCARGENQAVLHLMSILPSMNKLTVEEGRLPKKSEECVMDADYAASAEYKIGDTITVTSGTDDEISDTLVTDTFTIVGTVSSPCYIAFTRGSTTIGNGKVSGFVGVLDDTFAMEVYTEIYATVEGAKELTAFTKEYDSRRDEVIANVEAIREERENARYQEIVDEAEGELDKARQELEDGRQEAQAELDDAWQKITDGQVQIDDAKQQISDSRSELENSRLKLINGQRELDQNRAAVEARKTDLEAKAQELAESRTQYEALAASGMADEATLQAMAAQLEQAEAQVQAARAQLNAAETQFASAQAEIDYGWTQLYDGQSQLDEAEAELTQKEQELADARQEYEEGKADAEKEIADAEQEIADAEEEIKSIKPAEWYINNRDDLNEYTGYGENADRMKSIGEVFPVMFFLVAALISLTTMTRMVEEQRTQIGTLKALGYDRGPIAGKFLVYAALATVLGSILGVLFGEKIFPYIIITAYGTMYKHMHNLVLSYNIYYAVVASGIALACTLLATLFSCYKELREQSAQLMRPPAPKNGKRVFLERIPFIWNHLSFTWKSTIRNLIRYKKRFFMTIVGISGCMGLLLTGFGLEDSISNIGVLQYNELQKYDGNLILDSDAEEVDKEAAYDTLTEDSSVKKTCRSLLQQVSIGNGEKSKDVYLNVPEKTDGFEDFIVLRDRVSHEEYFLDEDGAVLTEKMAKELGVKSGDTIYIKDAGGEGKIKITAVCENYMYHYLYMTESSYEKVYGEKPDYNSVYYIMEDGKEYMTEDVGEDVLAGEGALSVSYTEGVAGQIQDMLSALDIVMAVLIISAGLLAFVVLYNLNNINITERKRELATLKVLGFYPAEVSEYVFRENLILTVIGAVAGCFLGKILHQFIIVTVEIDSAMFGRNIDFSSYVYSFLITIGFSMFVNFVMHFKLKKIDMVESLKSVE